VTFNVTNYNQIPVGTIYTYLTGIDLPVGAFPCDGRELSRSVYSDLFAIIGVTYGTGDGTTTFNIPELTHHDSTLRYLIQAVDCQSAVQANRLVVALSVVKTDGNKLATVTMQVQDSLNAANAAGTFALRAWFVTDPADPAALAPVPPTAPGASQMELVTDTAGLRTLEVWNSTVAWAGGICVSLGSEVFTAELSITGTT
jgi:microcystin-dependent protein